MDHSKRKRVAWLVVGLSLGLLFMGMLRYASVHPGVLTPLAQFATPGYVLITVLFTILLVRTGLPLDHFGFKVRPDLRQIILVVAAVIILQIFDALLDPMIAELLGGERNLERFSDVKGSLSSLISLLILSWTFAAFGEEFTYRIVLMRGISFLLGDSRNGQIFALLLQALMFGFVHAYQGPTGIVGSTISGLVYGAVVIASRRSIWPAAFAHGINNTIGILELYQG